MQFPIYGKASVSKSASYLSRISGGGGREGEGGGGGGVEAFPPLLAIVSLPPSPSPSCNFELYHLYVFCKSTNKIVGPCADLPIFLIQSEGHTPLVQPF